MEKKLSVVIGFLLLVLMLTAVVACGSANESAGICGDNICDEAEQADPSLCPQDCLQQPPPGSEPEEEVQPGVSSWSARVVWDCDLDFGDGQIDRWSVEINYDFTVDKNGRISGSGQGKPTRTECQRPGCACSLLLDDFSVDVSGLQQEDTFSLQVKPHANMQYLLEGDHCPGYIPVQQPLVCTCISGPLDVTIDAKDGAIRSFECNPNGLENAIAHGNTVLTQK
jgi:hypothetical protein